MGLRILCVILINAHSASLFSQRATYGRCYKTNDAYFSASMPPKSKRKIQLQQARAAKQAKTTGAGPPMPELSSEPATLPQQPGTSYACVSESADTELHAEDPLNEGVHDEHNVMENYASEWVESLSKDDLLSLSIVLWHLLVGILSFKLTSAAELIGRVVGRSDRTIREWRATFNANKGTFPDTLQGKYQRDGVLWQNEDLNKMATRYIRENTVVKGRPNLTAGSW